MNRNYPLRLATFLMLVGCMLLILFLGTWFAGAVDLRFLLFAFLTLFIASRLRRMVPRPEPGRFTSLRKMRQRSTLRRQQKLEKQREKEQEHDQINPTF